MNYLFIYIFFNIVICAKKYNTYELGSGAKHNLISPNDAT